MNMNIKRYREFFENGSKNILIIIDVQKSFKKYFTDNYLNELNKYCNKFETVYQIWDNHIEGKVDLDYLYSDEPDNPNNNDLYTFPNQKELIEKRYLYDVDVDFFKRILDKSTYDEINKTQLKPGMSFNTTEGTIITYIGNNHQWFHLPVKLYNLVKENIDCNFIICGGAKNECLKDVMVSLQSIGAKLKLNNKYTWTANYCPIK